LGEKRLGEACPVRKVLKHEACLLPEFPNRLPNMKFLYFMFDIIGNHIHLIKPLRLLVKHFLMKLKIFLI
jgi:hypothetical protein